MEVVFNADSVELSNLDADVAVVSWQRDGRTDSVSCRFVAGCDGSHGVCSSYLPDRVRQTFEQRYPVGWLGILAEVAPANDELIYGWHERGFTLASMRSPTRSRYYIQCDLDASLEDWPEERIWDEICQRLGAQASRHVTRGPAFEKSIAPLRSLVTEPMSYQRLFLAGDAAHIVPPTGAKGLNLAVSDVSLLAGAFKAYFSSGDECGLNEYSTRALSGVWQAQRFSWWFTQLTHVLPDHSDYRRKLQRTELDYLRHSPAQQRVFAENYVGLPRA